MTRHGPSVYTDGVTLVRRRGLRRGRHIAPPPVRSPAGLVHAAVGDEEATLCGLPTEDLNPFPKLVWAKTNPLLRCRDCSEALGASR